MTLPWRAPRLRGGRRTTAVPGVALHNGELSAGGMPRHYLLVTAAPGPGTPDAPSAVLIVLHGSSQTGQSVRSFTGHSFDLLAAGGRVAVVYPDGLKQRWNHDQSGSDAINDVAFIEALAVRFHTLHGPVPVIVAGFSNGGQLAIRLIHEIPHRFQGAAIIGATLPRAGTTDFADKRLPLPVLLVHGTHDLVVPYGGEGWLGSLFGRKRGPSAVDTAAYFAARNKITAAPARTVLAHRRESGHTSVTLSAFEQDGRAPVWLYTVAGGGHVVPNRQRRAISIAGRTTRDISTVEALTAFFPALGS